MTRFRLHPNGNVQELCAECGSSDNLADVGKAETRSVTIRMKLCKPPCIDPLLMALCGYSYDVEKWEDNT